jgi:hypothetical protein
VTLLSLSTSSLEYDFIRAREEGSGFITQTVSSTINSDYLRGLTIQMQHELFDRSELDPNLSIEFVRYASRLGIAFFDMTEDEWQVEVGHADSL